MTSICQSIKIISLHKEFVTDYNRIHFIIIL